MQEMGLVEVLLKQLSFNKKSPKLRIVGEIFKLEASFKENSPEKLEVFQVGIWEM